jgi:hypothetical protein
MQASPLTHVEAVLNADLVSSYPVVDMTSINMGANSASIFLHICTYVGVLISLRLFLFSYLQPTKRIYLGWVKEVRTTKP